MKTEQNVRVQSLMRNLLEKRGDGWKQRLVENEKMEMVVGRDGGGERERERSKGER